jgi:hypothetical protein
MGKLLALILALADVSLLILLVTSGNGNPLREAGLATSFLLVGALAWVAAFFNALYVAFRHGYGWRWILILLALLWLPALPVLAYGVSGLRFGARRRKISMLQKSRFRLPPADPALGLGRSRRRPKLIGPDSRAAA